MVPGNIVIAKSNVMIDTIAPQTAPANANTANSVTVASASLADIQAAVDAIMVIINALAAKINEVIAAMTAMGMTE
jgi:hypothetical protein